MALLKWHPKNSGCGNKVTLAFLGREFPSDHHEVGACFGTSTLRFYYGYGYRKTDRFTQRSVLIRTAQYLRFLLVQNYVYFSQNAQLKAQANSCTNDSENRSRVCTGTVQ